MIRKLKDEVYFRVSIDDEMIEKAKIGGLTGYDINLPVAIEKSKIDLVTDSNNKVMSAYDVAMHIYEKAKNIEAFRSMHSDFFYMFEMKEKNKSVKVGYDCTER